MESCRIGIARIELSLIVVLVDSELPAVSQTESTVIAHTYTAQIILESLMQRLYLTAISELSFQISWITPEKAEPRSRRNAEMTCFRSSRRIPTD